MGVGVESQKLWRIRSNNTKMMTPLAGLLLVGLIASATAIFLRPTVVVAPNTAGTNIPAGTNLGVTGNTVFEQKIVSLGTPGQVTIYCHCHYETFHWLL